MKNRHVGLWAYLCLVILSVLAIIFFFSDLKSQGALRVAKIELGKEIFRDQIERVVFLTDELDLYIFSSGQAGRIAGPESQIYEHLVKDGVKIESIVLMTHNHFTPRRFTPRNNKTFHYFKDRGFRGFFSIYYTATKKARTKKDE